MIRGLDELNQRIEKNFDKKTGKLRVPQSFNEWKRETGQLNTGANIREIEYAKNNNIPFHRLAKMTNALKFEKQDPLPMDAPRGYDINPCNFIF